MESVSPVATTASDSNSRPQKRLVVVAFVIGAIVGGALLVFAAYFKANAKRNSLTGKWFCRTTLAADNIMGFGTSPQVHEIAIVLNEAGEGSLVWLQDTKEADKAAGKWNTKNDFLIIDRSPGGFATFRIASQGDNRLTLVNRTGLILEFTRVN